MEHSPRVACITDFGTSDYYAGALRGTLARLAPAADVIDVTHEIPAGDVRRAALMLWESQPAFPDGTIFLVVVDPGVGGGRLPAAFRFPQCAVVGPDNGIVTFLIEQAGGCEAVEIQPRVVPDRSISNTFHGRDVFVPAAARLCDGEPVSALGPALDSPVRIPLPVFRGEEEGWEGEILYRDHFGNAVTSIGRIAFDLGSLQPWLPTGARAGKLSSSARVELANGNRVPLGRTYAEADNPVGCVGLAGSNGLLEIASWNQQTPDTRALRPGAAVRLISSR